MPSVDPTAKARTLKQLASPLVISILKERMPIKTTTPVVKSSEMQQTLHSDNLQVLHNNACGADYRFRISLSHESHPRYYRINAEHRSDFTDICLP